MSYFSNPQKTEAGDRQVVVSDIEIYDILTAILHELIKMNMHMSLLTDHEINDEDVSEEKE